uniref:Uncharacterized protein n=1 Tax=Arundo donax TaxID=35708 RepID=A0A0A9HR40_ARUDO
MRSGRPGHGVIRPLLLTGWSTTLASGNREFEAEPALCEEPSVESRVWVLP